MDALRTAGLCFEVAGVSPAAGVGGVSVRFTDPGVEVSRSGSRVVFAGIGQLAMALNVSGQSVDTEGDPDLVAAVALATVERVGMARIEQLDEVTRSISLRWVAGVATRDELDQRRAIWTQRRQRSCVSAAYWVWSVAEDRTSGARNTLTELGEVSR